MIIFLYQLKQPVYYLSSSSLRAPVLPPAPLTIRRMLYTFTLAPSSTVQSHPPHLLWRPLLAPPQRRLCFRPFWPFFISQIDQVPVSSFHLYLVFFNSSLIPLPSSSHPPIIRNHLLQPLLSLPQISCLDFCVRTRPAHFFLLPTLLIRPSPFLSLS